MLSIGSHVITLNFKGDQIQVSGIDPYKVWIGLYRSGEWNQLDSMDYVFPIFYQSSDFSQPDTRFEQEQGITIIADGPMDNYNALLVSFFVNSSVIGTYRIDGNLHKKEWQGNTWMWYPVAWSNTEIIVNESRVNTSINITLRFEGIDIYNSMKNGPWSINFNLMNVIGMGSEWLSVWDADDTIDYNYNQFTRPDAYLTGIVDNGVDGNGNLWIDALVNVSAGKAGVYEINANLFSSNSNGHCWIANVLNTTELTEGVNNVRLIFSGESIYVSQYNGSYRVYVELRNRDWLGGQNTTQILIIH